MKGKIAIGVILMLPLLFVNVVYGQSTNDNVYTAPSGEDFAVAQPQKAQEFNSFEEFWPMVAGKTRNDSFYRIKRLKEEARGWMIFGKPQKASYKVFLTVKRTLEAEKLESEGKADLAIESMKDAQISIRSAQNLIETARRTQPDANLDPQAHGRLVNLRVFTEWLKGQSDDEDFKLITSEINERIGEFLELL